jgi:hypothetical protein
MKSGRQISLLISAALFSGLSVSQSIPAAELRDPTRPADYPDLTPATADNLQQKGVLAEKITGWRLDSTLTSGDRKLAIINGALVSKGDRIGNMVVVDIEPSKALLRVDNKDIEVMLVHDNIKTETDGNTRKK